MVVKYCFADVTRQSNAHSAILHSLLTAALDSNIPFNRKTFTFATSHGFLHTHMI